MTPDVSVQILAELRLIRWLVFGVVVLGIFFVYVALKAGARLQAGAGNLKENIEHQKFQRQTEGLLQRGSYDIAIADAKKRLESHPSDLWAHYFLAQALFRMQKLHEARRAFLRVAELQPTWQGTVDAWLERVDEEIKESGPKVTK